MPVGVYFRTELTRLHIGDAKRGHRHPNYGKHLSSETRRSISLARMGHEVSESTRELISTAVKKHFAESGTEKLRWRKGLTKETSEVIANHAILVKKYWSKFSKEERRSMMAVPLKVLLTSKGPSKAEKRLLDIIDKACPNEYEYTGDGKLIIGYLCPDYANINGKKKLIEFFGDYWHNRKGMSWHQTEKGRISAYSEMGYDCLVIWESELNLNPAGVLERVRKFNEGSDVQGHANQN